MVLQTKSTALSPQEAYNAIRDGAGSVKAQAQNALLTMQSGPVNSDYIFSMLNELGGIVAALNAWKVITGLDSFATAQGYTGTLSTDCATCATAATACITWVVTNFPNSGGFLQSHTLNADGTRTPRSFTTVNTAGLQTNLQAFIATIG
jgi:hypothetical protein